MYFIDHSKSLLTAKKLLIRNMIYQHLRKLNSNVPRGEEYVSNLDSDSNCSKRYLHQQNASVYDKAY